MPTFHSQPSQRCRNSGSITKNVCTNFYLTVFKTRAVSLLDPALISSSTYSFLYLPHLRLTLFFSIFFFQRWYLFLLSSIYFLFQSIFVPLQFLRLSQKAPPSRFLFDKCLSSLLFPRSFARRRLLPLLFYRSSPPYSTSCVSVIVFLYLWAFPFHSFPFCLETTARIPQPLFL